MPMIKVIDYGAGNLSSVMNALDRLKAEAEIATKPEDLENAEKIILPGVGAFGKGMEKLRENGIEATLTQKISEGIPFLGICLGFQMLFEESEESPGIKGLGIFKGNVRKFRKAEKIPQIGWNRIEILREGRLFRGIENMEFVYYANSFFPRPKDSELIAAESEYGERFCAAIEKDNIFGVQFHPEKSGTVGLKITKNFLEVEK